MKLLLFLVLFIIKNPLISAKQSNTNKNIMNIRTKMIKPKIQSHKESELTNKKVIRTFSY